MNHYMSPRDRGRTRLYITRIAAHWDHAYDRWCVKLYLATVVGRDTWSRVKEARRVGHTKWKQDLAEGRRLVQVAVQPGGVLNRTEVRAMLSVSIPEPEW